MTLSHDSNILAYPTLPVAHARLQVSLVDRAALALWCRHWCNEAMKSMTTTALRSRQHGVAAVEFALLLPLLILMIFGTTELGRAIYSYNTLDKSVRVAGRHLSQHGPGEASIATEARCLAVHGTTDCSGSPVAPGLTTGMVKICDVATPCADTPTTLSTGLGSVNLVTVSIQGYQYNSLVEFVIPDMTFNNISFTMRSQL